MPLQVNILKISYLGVDQCNVKNSTSSELPILLISKRMHIVNFKQNAYLLISKRTNKKQMNNDKNNRIMIRNN